VQYSTDVRGMANVEPVMLRATAKTGMTQTRTWFIVTNGGP